MGRLKGKRYKPLFWDRVSKSDECWEWTGPFNRRGYGRYWYGERVWSSHRLSYLWAYGPIAEGLYVCHRCDNPKCVRPDHLFAGTSKENRQDAKRKGRLHWKKKPESIARGERHGSRTHPGIRAGSKNGRAKITEALAVEMRRLYATKEYRQQDLAEKYGLNVSTVKRTLNRTYWKNTTDQGEE